MRRLSILLAALVLTSAPAYAAEAQAPERAERQPHRQMTAEEKAQHDARRKEWEAMTPEQREAKMKEMRAKRGEHGRRGGGKERPQPKQ